MSATLKKFLVNDMGGMPLGLDTTASEVTKAQILNERFVQGVFDDL